MGDKEEAVQVLTDYKKSREKKAVRTRTMGSLGRPQLPESIQPPAMAAVSYRGGSQPQYHLQDAPFMGSIGRPQLAESNQTPADAASYQDGPRPHHHSQAPFMGAHESAQLWQSAQPARQTAIHGYEPYPQLQLQDAPFTGPHESAQVAQSAQPATQAAIHADESHPQHQLEKPAPVDDAQRKTSTKRLCFWTTIAISVATVVVMAGMVALLTLGASGSMPQDPRVQKPGDQLPALDKYRPPIRLNEAIDLPGLHCMAGRLLPLSDWTSANVTENPILVSEVFMMLQNLTDAEERLVSQLDGLRMRALEINRRRLEISTTPQNQSLSSFARVAAIRDMQSLVAQTSKLRQETIDLNYDIRSQNDGSIPPMITKAGRLCSKTEESTLGNVYRTQIWGGSGRTWSAGEEQLILLHRGFCSTVRSTIKSMSDRSRQGPFQSAAREAYSLLEEVDKLIPKVNQALKMFRSGCGLFCRVIWFSYELRRGAAQASPSH